MSIGVEGEVGRGCVGKWFQKPPGMETGMTQVQEFPDISVD
jgi:hypothetical protein